MNIPRTVRKIERVNEVAILGERVTWIAWFPWSSQMVSASYFSTRTRALKRAPTMSSR